MPKSKSCWAAGCLLILGACSRVGEVHSAQPVYVGIPAGLTEPCVVHDVPLETVGDLVVSRERYKAGFEKCAAKVDAIREHDAEARATAADD